MFMTLLSNHSAKHKFSIALYDMYIENLCKGVSYINTNLQRYDFVAFLIVLVFFICVCVIWFYITKTIWDWNTRNGY